MKCSFRGFGDCCISRWFWGILGSPRKSQKGSSEFAWKVELVKGVLLAILRPLSLLICLLELPSTSLRKVMIKDLLFSDQVPRRRDLRIIMWGHPLVFKRLLGPYVQCLVKFKAHINLGRGLAWTRPWPGPET